MKAHILCALQLLMCVLTSMPPAAAAPGEVQAGKTIYAQLCVSCHGPTGQGGNMAAMLGVPPRNLTDQIYMGTRSDQQLFDVISQGGAAVGLSAAMTAFGNQLSEQQIWDTVAYVRTLAVARSAAAASSGSSPASTAPPPGTELIMARLRLSIWPEYDDPRVLVMLRGEMTPRQAFPTHITLPLPKGAEIIGAGMISEQDELLVHPHQVLPGDTQDSLQLHLPAPRFFLEFYYNPFPASGIEKRFTYTASIAYPIAVFEVDIQQPLQASNFTLDPPPMERLTDNRGFTYYQFVTRDMRQGQTQTFTISYTKTTTSPSVPKQPPVPQRPGQRGPLSDNRPLALGILAGAIVLFAGWAWLLHDPRRQRASVTASAPQATATLSTLFALVQEHGETQETTVAMPPQAHPREINFCAHCGRKLLPDDRFCAGCGRPIKR